MHPDSDTFWERLMVKRYAWPRRFWTWLAVFACSRLNAPLWDEQCTFVVTQTGPSQADNSPSESD